MELIINETTQDGMLILSGNLTIDYIADLHGQTVEALGNVKNLTVNAGGAKAADLSFLQLLCSAHRTALSLNQTVTLVESSPALEKAITDNGYRRSEGCRLDKNETCLWVARKHE